LPRSIPPQATLAECGRPHELLAHEVIAIVGGIGERFDPRGSARVSGGRMVRIRHGSGYESEYLHLSAMARGISTGVRVAQGELIGGVGATGLATGPHLH
jgi:murein DD-endopeptidase MepM/ murein hydrolase activator NlpD